jgi:hypothetical protein
MAQVDIEDFQRLRERFDHLLQETHDGRSPRSSQSDDSECVERCRMVFAGAGESPDVVECVRQCEFPAKPERHEENENLGEPIEIPPQELSNPRPSNPSSVLLSEEQRLDPNQLRAYLEQGYRSYRDAAHMTTGRGDDLAHKLNFALARSINRTCGCQMSSGSSQSAGSSAAPMGEDLEAKYILHNIRHLYGGNAYSPQYTRDAVIALQSKLGWSQEQAKEYVAGFQRNPLNYCMTLRNQEVDSRLKQVPTDVLLNHSRGLWRGFPSQQQQRRRRNRICPHLHSLHDSVVMTDDLDRGEAIVPSLGVDIGSRTLQECGAKPWSPRAWTAPRDHFLVIGPSDTEETDSEEEDEDDEDY